MRAKLVVFGNEPNSDGKNSIDRARPQIRHTSMKWCVIGVSTAVIRMDAAAGPKSVTAVKIVWMTTIDKHTIWPIQLKETTHPRTDKVVGKPYSSFCCVFSLSTGTDHLLRRTLGWCERVASCISSR